MASSEVCTPPSPFEADCRRVHVWQTIAINSPNDATPDDLEMRKGKTIGAKCVLALNAVMVEVFRRKLKGADPEASLRAVGESGPRHQSCLASGVANLIDVASMQVTSGGGKALNLLRPQSLCLNDLRRTCCSQMAKAGLSLQTCADILGHEDIAMVRAVYRRVAPAELQAAMDMLPRTALPPIKLPTARRATAARKKAANAR